MINGKTKSVIQRALARLDKLLATGPARVSAKAAAEEIKPVESSAAVAEGINTYAAKVETLDQQKDAGHQKAERDAIAEEEASVAEANGKIQAGTVAEANRIDSGYASEQRRAAAPPATTLAFAAGADAKLRAHQAATASPQVLSQTRGVQK